MFSKSARARVGLESTKPELGDLKVLLEKVKEERVS